MKKSLLCLLAIVAGTVGACSSGSGRSPAQATLTQVHVDVFGWYAFVGAVLIDRDGRRTGWKLNQPIREIAGVTHEYGSEEGIPNETALGDSSLARELDTSDQAPADTMHRGSESTPMYHYFTIQDSAGTAGLLDQGGCELLLDPVEGGKVQLAVIASGIGVSEGKDTTSVWVKPGVPSRWWLSWKVTGDRCAVTITRVAARKPTRGSGK